MHDYEYVKLSNGRETSLKETISDYERLLEEQSSVTVTISELKADKLITFELKDDKPITSKLNVGEWFLISRDIIDQSKDEIRRKCNEEGYEGKRLWERFEKSNRIADMYPEEYPRVIETYIFERSWEYITEQQMRDMCEEIGDGMCDEIICDLELQMRICNGESAHDLIYEKDRLPWRRVVKLRDGRNGYLGGGTEGDWHEAPARFEKSRFYPDMECYNDTPYAFRGVSSKN